MENLEAKLKSAKPTVPELSVNFTEKILAGVEHIEMSTNPQASVALKQRRLYFYASINLLFTGLIFFNNSVFEIRAGGSLEVLHFGIGFVSVFFKLLPLDMILSTIIITGMGALLLQRSGRIKQGLVKVVVAVYLLSGIGGSAIAATGINEAIKSNLIKSEMRWPVLTRYYQTRASFCLDHANFLVGRVIRLGEDNFWVITPDGQKIKVAKLPHMALAVGQYLCMNGIMKENRFNISLINYCDAHHMERYFSIQT